MTVILHIMLLCDIGLVTAHFFTYPSTYILLLSHSFTEVSSHPLALTSCRLALLYCIHVNAYVISFLNTSTCCLGNG
jgi:hypothetical protein